MARGGGLLVAPSGPCLANHLVNSTEYKFAVMGAISYYLIVGLWLCGVEFWRSKLNRVSGLAFLKNYLMELILNMTNAFGLCRMNLNLKRI